MWKYHFQWFYKCEKIIRRWSGSSSILNLMIFDLNAVVSNFVVKRAHNLIGSFFLLLFLLWCLRLYSLSSEESESSLNDGSDESYLLYFRHFFFLSRFFFFDGESDNDGSGSGSSGTCDFTFSLVKWWNSQALIHLPVHFALVKWWNALAIMLVMLVA